MNPIRPLSLAAALVAGSAAAQTVAPEPRVPAPIPLPWIEIPLENTDKPCTVDALDVDAKVDGLHARVSTTITIRNPNARPISAPLAFPLPDGATVCGYALEINGAMVDGVVVPKEKARVAFETEQRRGVDPGLVETVKGNVYRTRVYPVPASGTRRVRVDYVAPIGAIESDGGASLALPSPPVPLARRSVKLEVADWTDTVSPVVWRTGVEDAAPVRFEMSRRFWRSSFADTNVAAGAKLVVGFPYASGSPAVERAPDGTVWFCAAAGRPGHGDPVPAAEQPAPAGGGLPSFTVFWDASGSRAGGHAAERAAVARLAGGKPFRLVLFRDAVEPAREFATLADALAALDAVAYDGGTDLAAVAAALAAAEGPVLLFTDGMDTLSGRPVDFGGRKDVAAFVSGAETDRESLRQACGGLVFDPADEVSLSLRDGALVADGASYVVGFEGTGVADVQGVGPFERGRGVLLGRLVADEAEIRIRVRDGRGETLSAPIRLAKNRAVPGSTLATAWAAMRVQQLSPRADDNADELLALGRRFGLASPATSLLVLESLDQWLRHDIEPPATLPEMREQWLVAKKNRPGEDPEAKAARHLDMLKQQWKQRMEWWNTDWTEIAKKAPKPEPVDGDGERPGLLRRVFGGATRNAAARGGLARNAATADIDDGMVEAQADFLMAAESEAPAMAMATGSAAGAVANGADRAKHRSSSPAGAISVKAWSPDTPYLKALDAAWATEGSGAPSSGATGDSGVLPDRLVTTYLAQRTEWAASPAFYLDCAGWFFAKGHSDFAVRILSNLAELRIEDAALLRVMAWRLKEAKAYTQSIAILRRVCKLRPEDAQSWRDLALVLDEAGRAEFAEKKPHAESAEDAENKPHAEDAENKPHAEDAEDAEKNPHAESLENLSPLPSHLSPGEEGAPALLAEALELYRKVALTPWARHPDSISLIAVEEFNALYAWCTGNSSLVSRLSSLEPLPEGLRGTPDCDMRVVMAWDADETDVDLHVTEPSGEEAYYGHRRTRSGGDVSTDITDGYGPEEYLLRKAPAGAYRIRAHYFASHQQEVFGPATVTATIFTDWGRANQAFQTLSIRLDKAREMIDLGEVAIGGDGSADARAPSRADLRKGMTLDEVKAALGEPAASDGEALSWTRPGGRRLVADFQDGRLVRAVEILPGGAETILVQ